METELEYKEKEQSEPTALFKIDENVQNYNRVGMTTLMLLSLATNTLFCETNLSKEKDEVFSFVGKNSFTNLEITNTTIPYFDDGVNQNSIDEDFFDFVMKPIYTNEFTIKVKSFKIEKFIPSSF